ncbi:MAG: anti-sigma factor [Actinomycetota bacterium]
MIDHDRIEELIAARALGGIDPEDARALERESAEHGPDCIDCRRLMDEYDEIAGRLAFALAPAPVRAEMEDEILRRTLVDDGPAATSAAPPSEQSRSPAALDERRAARSARRAGVARGVAAVAAAFVLFAGGWVIGANLGEDTPLDLSAARVVSFDSQEGELAVAFEPGEPGVLILGTGLPSPGPGKVYEVWMIEGDTPTPGPCLRPGPDGSIVELVDAELGTTDTMAVTVEPEGCSLAPTSEPIAVADLA